ncbi:class I SAM-dependent methyltransferase [Nocardia asteroides]|uniref:class I SAM-dependent methyltransferase n=1 Tax=Nocardia asteroides TaxID=1824 RepID=UPI001E58104C|nr:class I SAM-dependent methyltransferase [Nocardia asteroides]UGT61968.1 class I SAM-dependent methyltransferase [Nocardia asteroides]
MNRYHLDILSSPRWAAMLERDLLPWITSVAELGDDVIEIGPGPGLTTDLLRRNAARVTAVEIDPVLAAALAARLAGTEVEVVHGDAAATGLTADRFSAAACFGVLHHVGSAITQDNIFRELLRVLHPGGVLLGSDSYDDDRVRAAHVDDLFVPLDPSTLPGRLAGLGFTDVTIDHGEYDFRFHARRPAR